MKGGGCDDQKLLITSNGSHLNESGGMPQYDVKGKPLNELKKQEVRQTHKKDGKKGVMPLCDDM